MALRNLVDTECGRMNSLVDLSSHFVQDHSHRDDGLRHRTSNEDTFTHADHLGNECLHETLFRPPQTFRMDLLLQEMREIEASVSQHAPIQAPGVAASLAISDRDWTQEYLESEKLVYQQNIYNSILEGPLIEPVDGLTFNESDDNATLFQPRNIDCQPYCFPGRRPVHMNPLVNYVRDVPDIEAVFVDPLGNVVGVGVANEIEEVWINRNPETVIHPGSYVGTDIHLENQVESKETLPSNESTASNDWNEFSSDLWSKLSESCKEPLNTDNQLWNTDGLDYNDLCEEYLFEDGNPMIDQPNALDEGKRRLKAGDVSGAVLCFEAAVQMDADNSEAWELLGTSQAENELEPKAIAALKKCLALDSGNLKALMILAICYTNENHPDHALHYLKEWVKQNPSYTHLVPKTEKSGAPRVVPTFCTDDIHGEVKDLYIAAARLHPKEDIDPDVQRGLGVLFNLSKDYDKAVDCFKTALQVRPNDSRIWNGLGATLANGHRTWEAIYAYHQALALTPGYVRVRYNVGLACMNLMSYQEAIGHFLIALNQQTQANGIKDTSQSAMSSSIWNAIRLVLQICGRCDLYDAVDNRDLTKLNREYGLNFQEGNLPLLCSINF